jgi:hypothetical protein
MTKTTTTTAHEVAIGLSFFNDKECLKQCLGSLRLELHPFFKVIAIDGIYKGFRSKSLLSTDGSREIVRTWRWYSPNSVYLYDYPNLDERHKRQKYVDIASRKNINWLLILDSDEYLSLFNTRIFFKELRWIELENEGKTEEGSIYGIHMYDAEQKYRGFRPRLWYRPRKIGYNGKHNKFTGAKKVRDIEVEAIQITHCHKACRPEKRQELQLDYESRLPALEA